MLKKRRSARERLAQPAEICYNNEEIRSALRTSFTAEDVLCCRELLHLGVSGPLTRRLDAALEREDPLSDLTLSLSFCTSDAERLHALNEFLRAVPADRMDVPGAFRILLAELRVLRADGEKTPDELAYMMYAAARDALFPSDVSCGMPFFTSDDPPLWDMYRLGCIFDEIPYLGDRETAVRLLDVLLTKGRLPENT